MKNKRSPFGEANSVRKKDSRAIIALTLGALVM
jgi:hypothetical protein